MYTRYAALRDERGLNDLTVAKMTGIPQSTIYDWKQRSTTDENARISVYHLQKIAQLFGVQIEDLL